MKESEPLEGSTPLGQPTEYPSRYDSSLLCPIPRANSRASLVLDSNGGSLPFQGFDLWTAYEVSWINPLGKPQVVVAEFSIPCTSANIIESKSFKLYLNSFNQTVFASATEVKATMKADLNEKCGGKISIELIPLSDYGQQRPISHFSGECIDDLSISTSTYQPQPDFLKVDSKQAPVSETLYSDLLKTNCPVTGQPDWASLCVSYTGEPINREGLLKYIISFREHQGFHEHCVEQIFLDISRQCKPSSQTVYARFTRRGGLDINPYRSTGHGQPTTLRSVRQ